MKAGDQAKQPKRRVGCLVVSPLCRRCRTTRRVGFCAQNATQRAADRELDDRGHWKTSSWPSTSRARHLASVSPKSKGKFKQQRSASQSPLLSRQLLCPSRKKTADNAKPHDANAPDGSRRVRNALERASKKQLDGLSRLARSVAPSTSSLTGRPFRQRKRRDPKASLRGRQAHVRGVR